MPAAINENQQLTVQELEEDLGTPQTIVSEILIEYLGKKHVVAKFVLQLLSQAQKEFCTEVAQNMLEPLTKPRFPQKDHNWR
jgi:hypothetical protein